ncbi:MAG TPA: hypothetical protein VK152_03290, partial [Paludibacter sp.]|nr:hypothetical protein [Paludibacter sp.]
MKYTILTAWLLFCSMLLPTLTAETLQAIPVELKWKGIEKWVADSSSVQVISFENAKYPNETRLPYYHQRISTNASAAYSAEITNPVFVPATSEEIALIQTAVPTEIEVNTQVFKTREGAYFDIYVLPFVKQGEAILKLKSFELHTSKTGSPQKAPAVTMHSYSESSVLAQGRFVKVRITDSGIYKLTYEDLVSMGVSPADVRVFGYGGGVLEQSFLLPKKDDLPEVAIWMEKGADGVFNAGDYILFYAQGVNRWSYDRNKAIFTHVSNSYSQYGYYFVTSDAGSGRKIENKPIVIPTDATINNVEEFTDYQLYEKDLVSIAQSGKNFYGEKFSDVTSYSFNFNFPNLVPAA